MKKKLKMIVFLFIIIFFLFEIYIFSVPMILAPKKSDAIIILGCRVNGETPSKFLVDRTMEGVKLYKEGYAPYIIVSGGQGDKENISEAECMKRILVKEDIPEDKIILEDNSKNTNENIKNSSKIMKNEGFKSAILVSNRFHLGRVKMLANRYKIDGSYTGTFNTKYQYLLHEIFGAIREIPAIIKDFIIRC
ncbi:YdcF family protein [Clostridium fallax]|uniref:Uncharacterized SAM-binding protein YcdF, DUF218 family n=1 Tax=Clostridium fallax TaxID=1533 RepID=A0A1M4TD36_9CLOT|nr:YdcF family protein [Clostridium fallax]SHE42278.1 Uncharacterized SAM-binding protein YcdF, DUF218 family [Clostridium fallax]SQB22705.1 membrane associated protein [Clostridium fallax]